MGVVALLGLATGGMIAQRSYRSCTAPEQEVTTVWVEANLDAIRRDFPAPTVHSRNLYHLSAAMWDTWAAHQDGATGVFFTTDSVATFSDEEMDEAISFAAYRVLSERYRYSVSSDDSLEQIDSTLESLCLDVSDRDIAGSPAAFGDTVAEAVLASGELDELLEKEGYVDENYRPFNEPLAVADSGTVMEDPNRWQPLLIEEQITQNGQALSDSTQTFIGSNWGYIQTFALERDEENGLPLDPGPPPFLGEQDDEFVASATEVVELSAKLDADSAVEIDVSPRALGNVELGAYAARGWDVNPATGEPYKENVVLEADYARVVAEYWADGPESETPPGHWNLLAIDVGNGLEASGELEIYGKSVERLEWDLKVFLAINGALHDTAVAVWGTKAHYDYARPISMIRYLGQNGRLNNIPGVVEDITTESTQPGERFEGLEDYIGEQAVYSWIGQPDDPDTMLGGVDWIRAADWLPYQRESFVSPAFAAYVSGHSGFSRAAAEVLTELTGDEFFPGGLMTHTVVEGALIHEEGPTQDIELQWATYRDAADQAGISRLYGGIHVRADDLQGRIMGEEIGKLAVARAQTYFG